MTVLNQQSLSQIHFVGIGGAGMSALARVLAQRGVSVSGSDMKESRYSRSLRDLGVTVFIGHDAENIGDADVIVYSTAISEDNPELTSARERGIELWHRAQMLGYLAGNQKTIAIAGTHGKTSTSSMVTAMLRAMGEDPTFCVGGEIDGINTNANHGTGEHYVVEADESDGSFLHLNPFIAVVTNIEADHLDHYADLDEIECVFSQFMKGVDDGGCVIVYGDNPHLVEFARKAEKRLLTYGATDACDVQYRILGRVGVGTRFEYLVDGKVRGTAVMNTPGEHMVANATAALAVAYCAGLDMRKAGESLSSFTGVRRRFDVVGVVDDITVVDDYAHHPTEVAATLDAAAALDFKRVIALFQPHRYSRTLAFEREFGESFNGAYKTVLLDVYSAGEMPIPGVTGRTICDAILDHDERAQVAYLPHRKDVVRYIVSQARPGDLIMTLGAGDVTSIGPELVKELERNAQ